MEYLPFETLIRKNQARYYEVLGQCDKVVKSTAFIEYMLEIIEKSLNELLNFRNRTLSRRDRLEYFCSLRIDEFSRKEYMEVFNDVSTATASRDLREGVGCRLFVKRGDKLNTVFKLTGVKK